MCSDTFKAVAHLTEELGCVGPEGVSYRNLYSVKGAWSKLFGYVLYCIYPGLVWGWGICMK